MEKKEHPSTILGVEPPHSKLSTVLNGVGNGAMIGGGIFVVPEMAFRFFKPEHQASHGYFRLGVVTGAIGVVVGAYYSLREAKQLDEYRTALAQRLNALYAAKDGQPPQTQTAR